MDWQREAVERGAGVLQDTGRSRWTSSAQAPCAAAASFNLPIFFSSGSDCREAWLGATTARYGRDSAAVGQGANRQAKRRSEGARALGPGRAADRQAGGFLWAATVAAKGRHKFLLPETGREPAYLGFQARLQLERSRSAASLAPGPTGLRRSRFVVFWPTHPPGYWVLFRAGGVELAASGSGAGSGRFAGHWQEPVDEQCPGALCRCCII